MAIESKRGCGYRKVGGTYMVSGEFFSACDRLPFKLDVCPCCGEGYRPSRNIRKIWPEKMLGGEHRPIQYSTSNCTCIENVRSQGSVGVGNCYICYPFEPLVDQDSGHYLEWIGEGFYKTSEDFNLEAGQLGISRRLKSGIPRDLVVGKSIIFLAHRKVMFQNTAKTSSGRKREFIVQEPAIFSAFVVKKLEHICTESEHTEAVNYSLCNEEEREEYQFPDRIKQLFNLMQRGVHLVSVPDNDPDHQ